MSLLTFVLMQAVKGGLKTNFTLGKGGIAENLVKAATVIHDTIAANEALGVGPPQPPGLP